LLSRTRAARLLFGGAGLLLIFTACSSGGSPSVGGAVADTTATVASSAAAPSAAASTTTIAGATTVALDGPTVLQQAVSATGGGYHFNQTASLDGAVALTIDGDRLPDGARLSISSNGSVVNYIYTSSGVYLMPENGEWELDDSPPAAVDPIAALTSPTSVTVASNDGTTVQLTVTVPNAALGIPADGDAALQVAVVGGALTTIAYSTNTPDGKVAATTVTIGPVADPSPVVPPI